MLVRLCNLVFFIDSFKKENKCFCDKLPETKYLNIQFKTRFLLTCLFHVNIFILSFRAFLYLDDLSKWHKQQNFKNFRYWTEKERKKYIQLSKNNL